MYSYGVGQVVEEFIGHQESTVFDITDNGAVMLVFFYKPTEKEIEQFSSSHPFEIRYAEFNNVIIITTKIGSLNWMDSPYSSHLSLHLSKFPKIEDNKGLALQLMLIDASTGEIKSIRLLGLSNNFSKKLINTAKAQREKPFNQNEHDQSIAMIFSIYNTKAIVDRSVAYCKINN